MNKDEAIAKIAKRLQATYAAGITWAQFVGAMGDLTAEEKAALLGAVRRENASAIGEHVIRQIRDWSRTQAVTEATTMLADDAISLAELDKVL